MADQCFKDGVWNPIINVRSKPRAKAIGKLEISNSIYCTYCFDVYIKDAQA